MSVTSFPIVDLIRRKKQTILTISGLTIATAATLFLILFGNNLGFDFSFLGRGDRLTSGFYNIFSQFILIVSILNIVTGPIIISFLIHLTMSERIRDIGIMKAVGSLRGSITAYFLTELSLIVFTGTTAGTVLGVMIYYLSTYFLNYLGFNISQHLNLVAVIVVYLITIIFSHFFGAFPIIGTTRLKATEALSPVYRQGITFDLRTKIPEKLGYNFKIAYRNIVRRKSKTIQMISCLILVLTLTTVTITGGIIAEQTTISYVERAIGRNTVIIGHPIVTQKYIDLLSNFFEEKESAIIDYFNEDFFIPESLISNLNEISGITNVDPRLIFEHSVQEVPGVISDPIDPLHSLVIGGIRSGEALIVGVEPKMVINDWLLFGRELSQNDTDFAVIGDSLAVTMFADAQNQAIKVFEEILPAYDIVGVCVDPLNNGKVVYLPLNTLFQDSGVFGYNLVFIEVDASKRSSVFIDIKNQIFGENLSIVELEPVLDEHVTFLESVWSLVMFLPLFSLVTAVFCLLSYLMLSISCQQHEFAIMRALGAKTKGIRNVVFYQGLLIVSISCVVGITIGLFISSVFLIPDPVITQFTIISVFVWLFFVIGFLCTFSLYPAIKFSKKKIIDSLHSI